MLVLSGPDACLRLSKNEGVASFGGGGGASLLVSIEISGLMTLYASREKKRTFCPVPGVLGSRRMERTDPMRSFRPGGSGYSSEGVGLWVSWEDAERGGSSVRSKSRDGRRRTSTDDAEGGRGES